MFFLSAVTCLLPLVIEAGKVTKDVSDKAVIGKESQLSDGSSRDEKFLSVFQIVKFQNGACPASSGDTGVCFTEAECSGRGGVASGSCASSFGVCCVFTLSTCGDTVTNNNTYITSPDYPSAAPAGMCMFNINKCDSNICQIRLEYEDVVTAGPSMGDCGNDTIMISQVDSTSAAVVPESLCGTLSGQHMVLDVKDQTDGAKITFNIGASTSGTKWRVKVIQLSCDDTELLAPAGCLTYDTASSGNLQTYNVDGGSGELINNQKFTHCIKHQDGFCDIQLTSNVFELSAGDSITFGSNTQTGTSFGSGGNLAWNFTGPYTATFCSDGDNADMVMGYDIGYLLLPCQ